MFRDPAYFNDGVQDNTLDKFEVMFAFDCRKDNIYLRCCKITSICYKLAAFDW